FLVGSGGCVSFHCCDDSVCLLPLDDMRRVVQCCELFEFLLPVEFEWCGADNKNFGECVLIVLLVLNREIFSDSYACWCLTCSLLFEKSIGFLVDSNVGSETLIVFEWFASV